MESIPLRKEGPEESLASHRQIQDLDDSDEGAPPRADGNRLGILYDFLLPDDALAEPLEEWTYDGIIREFAEETGNPAAELALVRPETISV
jgi:hypothetical protein